MTKSLSAVIGRAARKPSASLGDWFEKSITLSDGGFWGQFLGGQSSSGKTVNVDNAMQLSAVWSCVRIISTSVAGLPLGIYRREADGGRKDARDFGLYDVIHNSPNEDMTAFQFWQAMVAAMLLRGNAFAEILRIGSRIVALDFLLPSRVDLDVDDDGRITYWYRPRKGARRQIDRQDMLHIPAFSLDGRVGLSAIRYGADVFGAAMSADDAANGTFKNGLLPAVAFKVDRVLKPEQREEFRDYVKQVSGALNAGRSPVLEQGITPETIGINPVDAQLLESRGYSVEEVCFVPGTKILTLDGFKAIENVEVGELVLTHRGRWRAVRNVMQRGYSGEVVTAKAKGLNAVTSTVNHPFYVQKVKPDRSNRQNPVGQPQWIDAGELTPSKRNAEGKRGRGEFHALTIPKLSHDVSILRLDMAEWAPADAVKGQDRVFYSGNHRATGVRRFVDLNAEFGWICGIYASDGSVSDHQVVFYLGAHETVATERLIAALSSVFGVSSKTTIGRSVARTVVSNRILAEFFSDFGRRADLKVLPNFVNAARPEFRRGVIDGLVDGDGCVYGNRALLRTTSERLAWQTRLMLWAEGLHGSMRTQAAGTWGIEGRNGVSRPIHTVEWRLDRQTRGSMAETEDIVYFGLDSADKSQYCGAVYNLEVDEDESYTTEGGCVHNCRWFGVPPWMVGKTDAGSNWGTGLEQQMIAFLTFSISSITNQIQQCVNKRLLTPVERQTYYAEFSLEAFLKADSAGRSAWYSQMTQNGIMTRDECRVKENLPRHHGNAAVLTVQTNLTPIDKLGESTDSQAAQAALKNWLGQNQE